MRVSLLCPTRGRPQAFVAMVDSALTTAGDPDSVEVVAVVDSDDRELATYVFPTSAQVVNGDSRNMSDLWNAGADVATADVMMLCADDLRFRSFGWDDLVLDEFERWPDRLVNVWGDDGNENGQRATHPFLHRRWVDLFGRFTPPHFVADYCDLWLYEVAAACGRSRQLPGLFIEHMHISLGKSPDDETERRKVERQHGEVRPALVWDATADERAADIAKLRAATA